MRKIQYKFNLLHRYLIRFAKRLSEKQLLIIIAVIVGLVTAFTAVVFEAIIVGVKGVVSSVTGDDSINYLYLVMPIVGIVLVTIFVKKVIKDNISHGVTRILYAITHGRSYIKFHNTYSSVVAGAITIGFGGSVGPEAPIVMTGAAVGSNIGRLFRMNYRNTTILLGCGAAGALAAIFKAPIAGVIFVLEVLMLNLSIVSTIPILIAAVTAASVTYLLHGFDPLFAVTFTSESIKVSHLPYYVILAVMCGFSSYYLIATSSKIEGLFKGIKSQYKKWLIGGVSIGILIMLLPPLYGQGSDSITALLEGNMDAIFSQTLLFNYRDNIWIVLLLLGAIMLFKSIAMALTNAAGGVGGAFAPSLFLGAFTGYFTATLLNQLFGLNLPVLSFTLVGMTGVMSGAMNSPLTAVFLIAEITGGYRLFMPLMLVSAVSFAICYYFLPYSIYTRELVLKGDIASLTTDRSLLFMNINKLIESDFAEVNSRMPLGKLVEVVSVSKRNIFPVLTAAREIEGYVTLDDIRIDMFDHSLYNTNKVYHYMTVPPAVITSSEPISSILDKFDKSGAWNLPVVNAEGRYQGFISKSKLFSEYRNELTKQ